MNASTESRLLRLAIAKGLLSWDDLDDLADGLPDEGDGTDASRRSWIELLLASGRLDAAAVAALTAELGSEPPTGPREPIPTPPELRFLSGWPRYRLERHLGAGGMGSVYLAWDPSLNRRVALKFLHRNDPVQTARFLREARAQARVEHPNVCQVYEVGEVEGRPYIAMQYIEGTSLSELRGTVAPEEAVRIVRDVAQAIQAAHRSGLIHRDLKPGNILLGTDDAGQRHPYVVDFGLAQDQSEESLSRSGMISGTPAYVSPEQAQGDPLDRRSDVYSLGIVLYELLAGQPPFLSSNPAGTLVRILQEDARPLRKVNPHVAQDLETVVMKTIEKHPDRRYESARALADDLERFLDGEPIQARPAGWRYRAGKKLRKHRALAAVAAASLLGLMVLGGIILYTRWQSRERAVLAQRFGQRVAEVEAGMRYDALLPRHDTTASKRRLRRELDEIRAEMERLGPIAQGPGSFALGQGYLALHETETAREHLERAWKTGEHSPEVAAALGRALGLLYEKALVDASRGRSADPKASREEADAAYRRPALSYLKEAAHNPRRSDYLAGLTAFYEGRYDEAVARARDAYRQTPWFYEAAQLEAEVYRERGEAAATEGRPEEAVPFFDRAAELYSRILAAVPSDGMLYSSDCARQARGIELARQFSRPTAELEQAALATCDRALEVDPELGDALVNRSWIEWGQGDQQARRGIDPHVPLAASAKDAERAIAFNPRDAAAHKNLAVALRILASWEMGHGADPGPSLVRSIAAARKAVELQPELSTNHNSLGLSCMTLAGDRQSRGGDPVPPLRQAIDSYSRAVDLNPRFLASLINLGNAWNLMAETVIARGADPSEAIGRAVAAFERAASVSPRRAAIYNNLGNSYLTLADYLLAAGVDPRPTLEKAAASYAKAVELQPDYVYGPYNQASAQRRLAQDLLDRGTDPAPALTAADAFLDASLRVNPSDADTFLERGRLRLIAARAALRLKQDPEPSLASAGEALRQAEALNPAAPEIFLALAEVERCRADAALAKNENPSEALRGGLGRIDKVLALNPEESQALALRGALELMGTRVEPDAAVRREKAARAASNLEKALRLNPLLRRQYGTILDQARGEAKP